MKIFIFQEKYTQLVNMRIFIAVDVPKTLHKPIEDLQKALYEDGLKMVKPEKLHITIKFLGERDEKSVKLIMNKLTDIKEEKFTAKIHGLGVFPNSNYIKVVWIGIEPAESFRKLAKSINNALSSDEPFEPHLTIARVKKRPENLTKKIGEFKNKEIGYFEVSEFKLKKSTLTPEGPVYQDLASFDMV